MMSELEFYLFEHKKLEDLGEWEQAEQLEEEFKNSRK